MTDSSKRQSDNPLGNRLLVLVRNIWQGLRDAWFVIKYFRVSLAVVLIASFFLFLTNQGREISIALEPDCGPIAESLGCWMSWAGSNIMVTTSIALWAFLSWVWATTMLRVELDLGQIKGNKVQEWIYRNGPRILGATAFGVSAITFAISAWKMSDTLVWFFGVYSVVHLGFAFGLFFFHRALYRLLSSLPINTKLSLGEPPDSDGSKANRSKQLSSLSKSVYYVSILFFFGMCILISIMPAKIGFFIGAPALLFLFLSSLIPIGSALVRLAARYRFPVFTTLLVWAIIFSMWADNHNIRIIDTDVSAHDTVLEKRPNVRQAVLHWRKSFDQNYSQLSKTETEHPPMIVVATAGGGLRAAYWTATVLGALRDRIHDLDKHLFAISGVSGGSLGAAAYMSVTRDSTQNCDDHTFPFSLSTSTGLKPGQNASSSRPRLMTEQHAQSVLAHDFLGPALAGLLFTDLLQRFMPIPWFPDRAETLERGWEVGWNKSLPCLLTSGTRSNQGMAMNFFDLWPQNKVQDFRPALFFNGTHQETGRRIITSNLKIDGYFTEAYDFFDLHSGPIRLSTAVSNSARFTYVSPPGTLKKSDDTSPGHIIDGGYFENFGAETAKEIANVASLVLGSDLNPILIQISSDPDLEQVDVPSELRCGDATDIGSPQTYDDASDRFLLEIKAPISGIFNTRQARGIFAAHSFARQNCNEYFHFRMCSHAGSNPPLGWLLSRQSREHIFEQLTCGCGNQAEFKRLLESLGKRGIEIKDIPQNTSCPAPWSSGSTGGAF